MDTEVGRVRLVMFAAPSIPMAVLMVWQIAQTSLPDVGTVAPAATGVGLLLVLLRIAIKRESDAYARFEVERTAQDIRHAEQVEQLERRIARLRDELDDAYRRRREGEGR